MCCASVSPAPAAPPPPPWKSSRKPASANTSRPPSPPPANAPKSWLGKPRPKHASQLGLRLARDGQAGLSNRHGVTPRMAGTACVGSSAEACFAARFTTGHGWPGRAFRPARRHAMDGGHGLRMRLRRSMLRRVLCDRPWMARPGLPVGTAPRHGWRARPVYAPRPEHASQRELRLAMDGQAGLSDRHGVAPWMAVQSLLWAPEVERWGSCEAALGACPQANLL